jgi:hypothetical protein
LRVNLAREPRQQHDDGAREHGRVDGVACTCVSAISAANGAMRRPSATVSASIIHASTKNTNPAPNSSASQPAYRLCSHDIANAHNPRRGSRPSASIRRMIPSGTSTKMNAVSTLAATSGPSTRPSSALSP